MHKPTNRGSQHNLKYGSTSKSADYNNTDTSSEDYSDGIISLKEQAAVVKLVRRLSETLSIRYAETATQTDDTLSFDSEEHYHFYSSTSKHNYWFTINLLLLTLNTIAMCFLLYKLYFHKNQ